MRNRKRMFVTVSVSKVYKLEEIRTLLAEQTGCNPGEVTEYEIDDWIHTRAATDLCEVANRKKIELINSFD